MVHGVSEPDLRVSKWINEETDVKKIFKAGEDGANIHKERRLKQIQRKQSPQMVQNLKPVQTQDGSVRLMTQKRYLTTSIGCV